MVTMMATVLGGEVIRSMRGLQTASLGGQLSIVGKSGTDKGNIKPQLFRELD